MPAKPNFNILNAATVLPKDGYSLLDYHPIAVSELVSLILSPAIRTYNGIAIPETIESLQNAIVPTKNNKLDLRTYLLAACQTHVKKNSKGHSLHLVLSEGTYLGGLLVKILNSPNPYSYTELSKAWDAGINTELGFHQNSHQFQKIGREFLRVFFALGSHTLPKQCTLEALRQYVSTGKANSYQQRLKLIRERWAAENETKRHLRLVDQEAV